MPNVIITPHVAAASPRIATFRGSIIATVASPAGEERAAQGQPGADACAHRRPGRAEEHHFEGRETNDTLLMTAHFVGAFAFGAAAAPFGWVTPGASDLLLLSALAAGTIVAQFSVIRSLKLASASVVVPYQYMLILWSVVFGWLMFAELPDLYTVAGAAIIVAAGLYIFWREQVTARQAPVTLDIP